MNENNFSDSITTSQFFQYEKELSVEHYSISYDELISKSQETVQKCIGILKKNRFIIISDVPKISELRKKHFIVSSKLNQSQLIDSNNLHVGFDSNNKITSSLSTIYSKEYKNTFKHLGSKFLENEFPKIEGIRDIILQLEEVKKSLTLKLVELIEDNVIGRSQDNEKLSSLIEHAEASLSRTLIYHPNNTFQSLSITKTSYDVHLFSVHHKDTYFKQYNNNSTNSDEYFEFDYQQSGIILINSEGKEVNIILNESDILIQPGLSLQLFSGKNFMAQPQHLGRSFNEPEVGKISHTLFIQPKFSTKMIPFDKNLDHQTNYFLKTNEVDKHTINEYLQPSNYWYPGVSWIDFYNNQRYQLNIYTIIKELNYPVKQNVSEKTILNKSLLIYHFNKVDSTHKFGENIPISLLESRIIVFIADTQSSGIGQYKNTWSSPLGNLHITYVVKAPREFNLSLLPQTVALSSKESIEAYSKATPIGLKWINDIFCNNKKISGVLVSAYDIDEFSKKLVISIGVNINIKTIESSICLKDIINEETDINSFTEKLSYQLIHNLNELIYNNNSDYILSKLRRNILYLNEEVDIWNEVFDKIIGSGVFLGINEYGNAIIRNNANSLSLSFISGRMRRKIEIIPKPIFKSIYFFSLIGITFLSFLSAFILYKKKASL